jgi:hypothetical protein
MATRKSEIILPAWDYWGQGVEKLTSSLPRNKSDLEDDVQHKPEHHMNRYSSLKKQLERTHM